MMSLFRPVLALRSHLSQDALTRMACQELSPVQRLLARVHLSRCSPCQLRYQSVTRATHSIFEFRQNVLFGLAALSPARRNQFIRRLDCELELAPVKRWWKPSARWQFRPLWNSAPLLGTLLLLSLIFLVVVGRVPLRIVSAAEFLDRAVASDSSSAKITNSGVICRRLRIKTAHKSVERSLYVDVSGRRRPKYEKASAEEIDFAAQLALAGVNWDDPLSAVSFKAWHDRQIDAKDDIHSHDGLLTISTFPASSNVAAESLTVRKESFHPVERIIQYRGFGTVSISELSLDILSPSNTNLLFLEPEPSHRRFAGPVHAGSHLLPNPTQINDAELQVRLILNEKGADTGEQIEISRDVRGVQVQGLVESAERKTELNESLGGIPFVAAKIRSFDDLKSAGDSNAQTTSVLQHSVVALVSPLEQYFVEHGRSRDDLSRISAGLFNASLAINRSSRSLQQTALRFCDDMDLSPTAIRARDELLTRIIYRLLSDLNLQQQFLDSTGIHVESGTAASISPQVEQTNLLQLAEGNMAATKQLVSSDSESSHSEERMAAELANTISQLRASALAFLEGRKNQP